MRLRFIFFIFLLICINQTQAQPGDLFLHHYQISIQNIDNQNFAVVQGKNDLMYFANKKGIVSYDGNNWDIIHTHNTPYSLAYSDKSGKVYVGCRDSFGYLQTDSKGLDQYVLISKENMEFGEITQIIPTSEFIYFYSNRALFKVSTANNQIIKAWYAKKDTPFSGIVLLNNQVFLNWQGKGLYQLKNNLWHPVPHSEDFAKAQIKSSLQYDTNWSLLSLNNHKNYWFDGKNLSIFKPEADIYLQNNLINHSLILNNNQLIFSTVAGGLVVMDKKNYQTTHLVNFQTGLPDDEVYAINQDRQGGLWICHAKGISRADIQLPMRAFSSYAGLEGNLETILVLNDSLFVASSDGLFYLSKVNRFEEIQSSIKKEQRYLKKVETITKTIKIIEPNSQKRIRTYTAPNSGFKEPKRKIETSEEVQVETIPTKTYSTSIGVTLFSSPEARKAYALQSIPYIFKKVEDLEGKCKQLVSYKDKILIASNLGFYEATKSKEKIQARPILKDVYINFISQSIKNPDYFYLATNEGIILIAYQNKQWTVKNRFTEINTAIYSIVEQEKYLWLGAESRVFRVNLSDETQLGEVRTYSFPSNYSENVTVRLLQDKLVFILSSGIYSYNQTKDKFLKDNELKQYFNPRSVALYHQDNHTWVKKNRWQDINVSNLKDSSQVVFLDFYEDIQDIYVDKRNNIWLISNNTLYKIDAKPQIPVNQSFNTFLRNVLHTNDTQETEYLPLDKLVFDYKQQGISFSFKVASPFYRQESAIKYQYWLEGLSPHWSNWDGQAIVAFPYLPSGKYKLHFRAKNIFGQISQEKVFSFEIKPPFWQTYWFYALQIGGLLSFLLLSFFFSRSGRSPRLAIIITIVTIITIFEFFSLILDPYIDKFANSIPVFKLGMNILLALTLLPAEKRLRAWLLRTPKRVTATDNFIERPTNKTEDKGAEI